MLAAALPVVAENDATGHDDQLTMAEASVTALAHAMEAAPSLIWPDANTPASLARDVPAAREQMGGRGIDVLLGPLHRRFLGARCNADGVVALVFEEVWPLLPLRTYAVAWRGSMSASSADGWTSVTRMTTVLDDPRFISLMGTQTFACP